MCTSYICKLQSKIYDTAPMMIHCNQNHAYPCRTAVLTVLTENKTEKTSSARTWVLKNELFSSAKVNLHILTAHNRYLSSINILVAWLQVSADMNRLVQHLGWQSSHSPVISTFKTGPPNLQRVSNTLSATESYVTIETFEMKCL